MSKVNKDSKFTFRKQEVGHHYMIVPKKGGKVPTELHGAWTSGMMAEEAIARYDAGNAIKPNIINYEDSKAKQEQKKEEVVVEKEEKPEAKKAEKKAKPAKKKTEPKVAKQKEK